MLKNLQRFGIRTKTSVFPEYLHNLSKTIHAESDLPIKAKNNATDIINNIIIPALAIRNLTKNFMNIDYLKIQTNLDKYSKKEFANETRFKQELQSLYSINDKILNKVKGPPAPHLSKKTLIELLTDASNVIPKQFSTPHELFNQAIDRQKVGIIVLDDNKYALDNVKYCVVN